VICDGYRLGFVSGVFGFVVSIHLDPLPAYTQIRRWHTLGFVVTTHKLRLMVSIRFDSNGCTPGFVVSIHLGPQCDRLRLFWANAG
jgi:hypothetical protein